MGVSQGSILGPCYLYKNLISKFLFAGKTPSLYRHELLALIGSARGGRSLRVLPPRLLPRRFALTTRVPDTRGK